MERLINVARFIPLVSGRAPWCCTALSWTRFDGGLDAGTQGRSRMILALVRAARWMAVPFPERSAGEQLLGKMRSSGLAMRREMAADGCGFIYSYSLRVGRVKSKFCLWIYSLRKSYIGETWQIAL